MANEELRNQLAESNQISSKSKTENTKLAKKLRLVTEQNDALKAQVEKASTSAESVKVKHEQDMQTLRRTMANLQREVGGYKDQIQALKSELDVKSSRHNLRATVQEAISVKEEPITDAEVKLEEVITPKASTSTPTIQKGQSLELTTTKQSLAHAHRMVNNLRMSLHKEKQEKHDIKKLLSESQEVIEKLQHDVQDISLETRSRTKNAKRIEHKTSRRPKAYGVRSNPVDVAATNEDVSKFDTGVAEDFVHDESEIDSATEDNDTSDNSDNEMSLSMNDISSHTTMKSLSSELADILTSEDPIKSTAVSPATISDDWPSHLQQVQTSQSNGILPAIVLPQETNAPPVQTVSPEPRQRTLSTSSLVSMSAPPKERKLSTAALATSSAEPSKPLVSLSSCALSSESAIPIEAESKDTQTEMPKTRQRTLSTSRLVPVSAAPVERGLEAALSPPVPEKTLSTSRLTPVSAAPVERDLEAVSLPPVPQKTLSTSRLVPVSAAPIERNLEVTLSPPVPQKTLSTSTLKPFDIEPTQLEDPAINLIVNGNSKSVASKNRTREFSTSKLASYSGSPVKFNNTATQTIGQQPKSVSDHAHNHDVTEANLVTDSAFSTSLRWSAAPDLKFNFAIEQPSILDKSINNDSNGNDGDNVIEHVAESGLDKNVGRSLETRSIGLQWPAEQLRNQEANETPELAPMLSKGTSTSDLKDDNTLDKQDTGTATLPKIDMVTTQPSRTTIESIDTASSPINQHFSIPDVNQTAYTVGPTGEQMMTRNEAEALAAAYMADALSKNKAHHSSQRIAWEQGRLLKSSSMAFLNAPPRPETPPSPNLIAKSAKPPKTPKMFLSPSPKPSKSTPMPTKTKSLRSSSSNASLRPALPSRADTQPSKDETRDDYGHALVRKSTLSLAPSASSSLSGTSAGSPMDMDHSYQRRSSFMSQTSLSMSNVPTNLSVITAITKTMIGEWLWKYTRRTVGGGISEHRHRRFFWVHPYTRTLYWSVAEPGVDGSEALAKSGKFIGLTVFCSEEAISCNVKPYNFFFAITAYIEAVMSVPNRGSVGDSSASLLIKTANRELKLAAPDMEKHTLWYKVNAFR